LLEVKNLTKQFGGLTAVDSLNFTVHEGETVSIIGPNGAGKTTVFNLMTGFHQPTTGDVIFNGKNLVGRKPHEIALAGIGRTFQIVKPFRGLTVFENILVGAFAHTDDKSAAHRIAEDIMTFSGLAPLRNAKAVGLPIAMRKRLELARSLATQPKIILLDEVMAGLNPTESKEAVELIKQLKTERCIY
jgi:branched-chain amino acid transport system ATP-binding protein